MSSRNDPTESYFASAFDQSRLGSTDLFTIISAVSFTYIIFDHTGRAVIAFEKFDIGDLNGFHDLTLKLRRGRSWIFADYRQSTGIIKGDIYTLIPFGLFDKDNIELYLEFNHQVRDETSASFDRIKVADTYLVYSLPTVIQQWMTAELGTMRFRHHCTVNLECIMKQSLSDINPGTLHVHVWDHRMDIAHVLDRKLNYLNTFDFKTKEEFIYFILLAAKQLGLSPNEFTLQLSGDISSAGELSGIAHQYVRNIRFAELPDSFKNLPGINSTSDLFLAANSMSCV